MRKHVAAALLGGALGVWWLSADDDGWRREQIGHRLTFTELEGSICVTLAAVAGAAVLLAERPRRAAATVALAASSLALSWGLLEIPAALGWVDWSRWIGLPEVMRFTRIKPWDNPSNIRDPELLFRHRAGLHFAGESAGDLVALYGIATRQRYPIDVRYDSNGFRNDPELERAQVAVVGDSFVEAGLVPLDDTLPRVLARRIQRTVVNLGHSGYGPQQEQIVLQRYALPLRPDLIVWCFFEGNDLLDVPRYERMKSEALQGAAPSSFATRSFRRNGLLGLAALTGGPAAQDEAPARARSGAFGEVTLYFAYNTPPLEEAATAALTQAQEILTDARDRTEAAGARFVLAFLPVKFRVYRNWCSFPADGVCSGWTLNDLPARLARWSAAEGIAFLDLTPPLRTAAEEGVLVYFPDDGHWNAAGNRVAADAIATRLAEWGWVGDDFTRDATSGPPARPR